MEDDDEFGDLYTDVLLPFQSSSFAAPPPPPPQQPIRPAIDLNIRNDDVEDEIPANSRTLAPVAAREPKDAKLAAAESETADKDVDFDIEEAGTGAAGLDAAIPGLSAPTRRDGGGDGGGEEDWESDDDSEDDLRIVLNDDNHRHMAAAPGGNGEDDEEGLEILVDSGELNQPVNEEWQQPEDGTQPAATAEEGKELGERSGGGGTAVAPKVGYSSHGYHQFHSQFKYVRPGAVPMPGPSNSGPGGVPGQVRPPVNMGPVAGRGRGEWRPAGMKNANPMQKNFHSSFGTPGWGSNMGGRGFGVGLEFTLPSHKTIFDVDVDGFEEKSWKHPGVDVSDYFNFGLNEESWRDYCRQLAQLRLESTMQSKIRVYESGRTEQEYDPDLPPELALATGIHDFPAENANPGKSEVGQSDFLKGSARVRPPIPTGRAIQVESGYGERFPSCENRPQRMRDSDAVIEIVLQDSLDDDSSVGNGIPDTTENGPSPEDFGRNAAEEVVQDGKSYFNDFSQPYNNRKRDVVGRKKPFHDNIPEANGSLSFHPEVPVQYAGSGDQISLGESRGTHRRARDRSPHLTSSRSTRDKKFPDNQKEGSVESDGRRSSLISSPVSNKADRESSLEHRESDHEEAVLGNESPGIEKEEVAVTVNDELLDGVPNNQKLSSRVEQSADEELDDGEDSKAARSSDNSRARSGSSRDYQKWRDGVEEEVIQKRSTPMGGIKTHLDENERGFQRKTRDGRQEPDRSHMAVKGREGSYPYRDWDPSSAHHLQLKNDGLHRRRDNLEGAWQRRDDDPYSRRIRAEEPRKRERGDEMGSRPRSKVREIERNDKDEYLLPRKQLDNGSYRGFFDKDIGSRPREREDSLKGRYEYMDDYHGKRRKDEEYTRRDHMDKEELLHGHRETSTRRKREREEVPDLRKRDDHQKARDNLDDHHFVRHKDDSWSQRERVDRPREREDWHRLKQSHEENIPKRERDDGRVAIRGGRGAEDKAWVGHARAKDENKGTDKEHQYKETVRHSDPSKRRDRVEEESSHHRGREDVHARGNQMTNDERRSGKERSSTRNERADSQKVHERKHKENTRKNKEAEIADNSTAITSKRHQEDQSGHSKETGLKGTRGQGLGHLSKRHREDASSDDEQQDSRKGRSKLERWTSHKERDFSINSKSSSTLKFKEIDRSDNKGPSDESKLPDESSKPVEVVDNQHSVADENAGDQDMKDADTKPLDTDTALEGRHLDTVEKLKKRSERFKLPLPSEKEASTIKKIENEVLPSPNSESPVVESEIKPERPARKRRWISN